MPNRDKAGPCGKGSMTGLKMGNCPDVGKEESPNINNRGGLGRRRAGFGRRCCRCNCGDGFVDDGNVSK